MGGYLALLSISVPQNVSLKATLLHCVSISLDLASRGQKGKHGISHLSRKVHRKCNFTFQCPDRSSH